MTKMKRAVGIDLGTTNSAVAMLAPDGRDLLMFEDRLRRRTIPSVVGWDPEREELVTGWKAWNRRVMEPAPVTSIKRKMGTQREVSVGPREMSPEEISAQIVSHLGAAMSGFLDDREGADRLGFDEAVITVPAYFDAPQIEATRRAGELAGLGVVGLLQEPTAAAMYYAWKHGIGDGTFMVYDLGGGTFDVSIIRSIMGEYQVLAIDGDNYLGGDDFDRRLAEYFREHLGEQGYELDLNVGENPDDALKFTLLTRLAQEVKEALTNSDFQYVGRRNLFDDQAGQSVSLDLEVGRNEFEDLIEDLVDQSIESCRRAVEQANEQAGVSISDIDHVLLVGGSTRVPLVQDKIAEELCGEDGVGADRPLIDDPDASVAYGAAIHASNLYGTAFPARSDGPDLRVTNALYSRESQTRLHARAAGASGEVTSAALLSEQSDVVAVARTQQTDDGVEFSVEDIELETPGRHAFSIELCDADGEPVHVYDIALFRHASDAPYRPTGSALSNPTVLAKDIYLEVADDGEAKRELLVGRGTSLPTEKSFRFFTGDRSGAVLLRLFQNRFPIRTLHLDVPDDTEPGTPVDLTLEIDETMDIVATGEVRGQKFWAQIEPPPPRELKDWEQIESMLDEVDRISESLWGVEERLFDKKTAPLVAGIREAARTDPDKLQVLVRRLEGIVEDYHNRDAELTPGYGRMSALINAVKRVVYRGDRAPLGRELDEWRTHIEDIETRADDAYDARDQDAWRRTFDQLQATWESLAQEEYRYSGTDPEEQVRRTKMILERSLEDLQEALQAFTFSDNPETKKLQRQARREITDKLEEQVVEPLEGLELYEMEAREAKRELDKIGGTLEELDKRYRELPTLGLVRR
jgi:molecular chaperone DnaK